MAVAPLHADRVDDLMRCADLALFRAKEAKTGVVVYDPDMGVHQPNRLVLLGDLRRAMEQPDELVLHYQPKVGLRDGRLCGVEALVRWSHPVRGVVSPAEFIPIAESTGLINRLTAHVLSPRCLLDPELLGRVRQLLTDHRVPARTLRLEVTETAVMANPSPALKTLNGLHDLRDLGCDIAQGYHYARPMPPADLAGWLRRGGPDTQVRAPVRMSGAR